MKYAEVRGAIRAKFGTQQAFAKAMDMHYSTLSSKLSGKTDWTRQEMEDACKLLELPVPVFFNR